MRNLALVALIIDARVIEELQSSRAAGREYDEYAVIKYEQGRVIVLYTIRAISINHAFYMMCADACDHSIGSEFSEYDRLDPEYRTLEIETVLREVAEMAEWHVGNLWDAFCDCRNNIQPYDIVPATSDLLGYRHFGL